MSLMTYAEVRPWARSIRNRVAAREMPPWHIDRRIGIQDFKNDPSLTDAEIDTITRWWTPERHRAIPATCLRFRSSVTRTPGRSGRPI